MGLFVAVGIVVGNICEQGAGINRDDTAGVDCRCNVTNVIATIACFWKRNARALRFEPA